MIKKLYNLKKLQLDQSFSVMQNLKNQVFSFEEQNSTLQNEINTQSVSAVGAIRDFYALEIHKKNLRQMIKNNFQEIESLQAKISIQNQIIAQLMKEKEQFGYILEQQKIKKQKEEIKMFENESSELVQYRYING